jgi:hypothetical protein
MHVKYTYAVAAMRSIIATTMLYTGVVSIYLGVIHLYRELTNNK